MSTTNARGLHRMIQRSNQSGDTMSTAIYSDCETYRYSLGRDWGAGPRINFVMLNPSTADEMRNDPTVERCERRARALGFGGFCVTNLFAYRATAPRDLKTADLPVGGDNDAALLGAAQRADMVLCAWGVHGSHQDRAALVEAMLRKSVQTLWILGLTQAGAPRHPLYLPYAATPQPWR